MIGALPPHLKAEALLGAGTVARAYRVRNWDTGERAVVKMPRGSGAARRRAVRALLREHFILAIGEVEGLPRSVDLLPRGSGEVFLVESEAPGAPWRRIDALDDLELARIVQFLLVLGRLHRLGHDHGDLRPDHIFVVEGDERVMLIDLSHSRPLGRRAAARGKVRLGTASYAAPELLAGGAPSVASDLYSAGICLVDLISGGLPEQGLPPVDAEPRWLRAHLAERGCPAPEDVVTWLEELVHPNPLRRPASAHVAATELVRLAYEGPRAQRRLDRLREDLAGIAVGAAPPARPIWARRSREMGAGPSPPPPLAQIRAAAGSSVLRVHLVGPAGPTRRRWRERLRVSLVYSGVSVIATGEVPPERMGAEDLGRNQSVDPTARPVALIERSGGAPASRPLLTWEEQAAVGSFFLIIPRPGRSSPQRPRAPLAGLRALRLAASLSDSSARLPSPPTAAHPGYLTARAIYDAARGRTSEARSWIEAALRTMTNWPGPVVYRARRAADLIDVARRCGAIDLALALSKALPATWRGPHRGRTSLFLAETRLALARGATVTEMEEAIEMCRELLAQTPPGCTVLRGRLRTLLALLLYSTRHYDRAYDEAVGAVAHLRLALGLRAKTETAIAANLAGVCGRHLGHLRTARFWLDQAIRTMNRSGHWLIENLHHIAAFYANRINLRIFTGDTRGAEDDLQALLHYALACGDERSLGEAYYRWGLVLLNRGGAVEAARRLATARALLKAQLPPGRWEGLTLSLIDALLEAGRIQEASELFAAEFSGSSQGGTPHRQGGCGASALLRRARIALLEGRPSAAHAALESAAAEFEAREAPPPVDVARWHELRAAMLSLHQARPHFRIAMGTLIPGVHDSAAASMLIAWARREFRGGGGWRRGMALLRAARRLAHRAGASYLVHHIDRFYAMAKHISEANHLPQQRQHLVALLEISQRINEIADFDQLVREILDIAIETVHGERGLLLLSSDRHPERLDIAAARRLEGRELNDAWAISQTALRRIFDSGRPVHVINTEEDPQFKDQRSVSIYGIRSILCVPLRTGEDVIGAVYVDTVEQRQAFSTDDVAFLEAFARSAAVTLRNARDRQRLEEENATLRVEVQREQGFEEILGQSPPMRRLFRLMHQVKDSPARVFLNGESGTGKELVARALHYGSHRRQGPFVAVALGSLSETVMESELFGHVRGAFTGADRTRQGLIPSAHGGTLFLDEIADISLALQVKLLRFLETGEVRPVGSSVPVQVDARIVSATNKDLHEEIRAGRFREDLYYRLVVVQLDLPPLRDRSTDILLLARHFAQRTAERLGKRIEEFTPLAQAALSRHTWPGNVRELQNAIERAVTFCPDGHPIDLDHLPMAVAIHGELPSIPFATEEPADLRTAMEAYERRMILATLERFGGNKTRAAEALGIARQTLLKKLDKIGVPPDLYA